MIDLAAFQADYHNLEMRTADVAKRWRVAEGSLAEFAQKHGLKTRKEMGIRAAFSWQKPKGLGSGGCAPCCPYWEACRKHMGREAVPCEVMSYLDEDPALVDLEPDYRGGAPVSIGLYFLE
jgi:hypothetical protein